MPPDPLCVARAFVAAINRRSVADLAALMADDHTFIDSRGQSVSGRESMAPSWAAYFGRFPDYEIQIDSVLADRETVALFGQATGTFNSKRGLVPENRITMPAAWKVVVREGKVALWQVYADWTEGMKIIERESTGANKAV